MDRDHSNCIEGAAIPAIECRIMLARSLSRSNRIKFESFIFVQVIKGSNHASNHGNRFDSRFESPLVESFESVRFTLFTEISLCAPLRLRGARCHCQVSG